MCARKDSSPSIYTSRDARRSSRSSCSRTNGERLAFSCPRSWKQPHDGNFDLQKERTEASSKPAQAQSQAGNVQALKSTVSGQGFADFPFQVQTLLRTTRTPLPEESFSLSHSPATNLKIPGKNTAHGSASRERSCCLQLQQHPRDSQHTPCYRHFPPQLQVPS